MTTGPNAKWEMLASEWQRIDTTTVEASSSLAARAQSRGRWLVVWVGLEFVILAVATTWLTYRALVGTSASDSALMATLAAVCVTVAAFNVWNWRGAWHTAGTTQRAFLEMSLSRCRRFRRALLIGRLILVAEVVCFVPWIAIILHNAGAPAARYAGAYAYLALLVIGGVVFLWALGRWIAKEESAIRAIDQEITAS